MKYLAALCLVACLGTAGIAQNSTKPYDTTQFAWWAAAANDSGQSCVAFVAKKDTVGDSIYPIYYQKYQGMALVKNDTLVKKWKRITPFDASEFSIVLDRHGAAHFVYCGDSLFCRYLSDRGGQWRQRAYAGYATGACGRVNCLALHDDTLIAVWTLDYRVGGGYPFSNIHYFITDVTSDSIANLYVDDSLHNINDEMIYDLAISAQCGRLVILQASKQYGGYAADKIIMSKGFPAISDFYCQVLRTGWSEIVTPIAIVKDEKTLITVSINGELYKIAVGDSGFTGTTALAPTALPAKNRTALRLGNGKVFDLLGRRSAGTLNSLIAPGVYFRKTADAERPVRLWKFEKQN